MRRAGYLALCAMLAGLAPLAGAAGTIAYVDYAVLLKQAPQVGASNKLLEQEFFGQQLTIETEQRTVNALSARLRKLKSQTNTLELASVSEKLKSAQSTLRKDEQNYHAAMTLRRQQLLANLKGLIQKEIASYAGARGIAVVLRQSAPYVAADADITQAILARLQFDYAAAQTKSAGKP